MPRGLVGVPGVLHCFTPAVGGSTLGSGLGQVRYVTLLKTLALKWDSLGMWQKKHKKNELRNVCLFVTENKKERETM